MATFFEELRWRGFLHSFTEGAEKHLAEKKVTSYIGFDPTATSLHVGSLLPIMGLVHFQRHGHLPIAVAGGGTGMIGDPSGKTQERRLLSKEEIQENLERIKKQLSQFLDFTTRTNPARIVNNADWLTSLSFMDFLRDIGKYFSINEMLAKDSVKSRLDQEQGMSFTEFSYALLQSYDFLQLFDRYDCKLQMGGSDQWGNIVSGIDLIRRVRGGEAHGIVFPLLTTSSGAKFGKSEGGTVWLDPSLTSPYKFYQYWYNTDDRDVIRYLKLFTEEKKEKIDELENNLTVLAHYREAQQTLATVVTEKVHGESESQKAVYASEIIFGRSYELDGFDEKYLSEIFEDVPSADLPKDQLGGEGMPLIEMLAKIGISKSKGEARRSIEGGGIYVNNHSVSDVDRKVTVNDVIKGKFVVLRKGKKNYFLVRIQ